MKIGCACGNILNDENLETTIPLMIFPDNDYFDVLESIVNVRKIG